MSKSLDCSVYKKYTDEDTFSKLVKLYTINDLLYKFTHEFKDLVVCENIKNHECKTYNDLYFDILKVCNLINKLELKHSNIGINLKSSYEYLCYTLGVMASGNVCVLLSKDYSNDDINKFINKFDIDLLITDSINCSFNCRFLDINDYSFVNNDYGETDSQIKSRDPACIVLTTGVSGKMKGAILSHEAILRGALNGAYCIKNIFYQTYYVIIPLTHVFGLVRNVFTVLMTGSKLVFATSVRAIFKEIMICRPTILVIVPAIAEVLLNIANSMGKRVLGDRLETIICGGASVSSHLVLSYNSLGIKLFPGYGLTELSNIVTGNPESLTKPNSCGVFFPEQEYKIVDNELWIKGTNLMNGYYKDDEENSNSFCEGYFKTGDLVRVDNDGYLYITGRKKDIIILQNGENISPIEIEQKVNELEYIQDSLLYDEVNELGKEVLVLEVIIRKEYKKEYCEDYINNIKKICNNIPNVVLQRVIIRDNDFLRDNNMKIIRPKRS